MGVAMGVSYKGEPGIFCVCELVCYVLDKFLLRTDPSHFVHLLVLLSCCPASAMPLDPEGEQSVRDLLSIPHRHHTMHMEPGTWKHYTLVDIEISGSSHDRGYTHK